jgi:membrane protease subunit HflK
MSYNQGQDFNYELEKLKAWWRQKKSGLISTIIALVLVIAGFTSFYTVEPDEEAVVIRLGRYLETNPPGLHFKIPLGIDNVIKVKTKIVHQEEFGFRTTSTSSRITSYSQRNFEDESLMLTGDLNVAEVQWVVQYQIANPFNFIFKTSEPIINIRDVAESMMRRVVGDKLVGDVLTTGRVEISDKVKILMQEVLDKYDLGVRIHSVKLQDVNPPNIVKPSFNEVNEAKQEQEKLINQAEEAYNKVIPEARGKAEKLLSEAKGYADALINRAEGDAGRFSDIYSAYRTAPSITKKRIYLETMQDIFKTLQDVTIVDKNVKGLLPIYKGIEGGQK